MNTSPERKMRNWKSILPALLAALFLPGLVSADAEAERIFSEMKQAVAAIKDYEASYSRYSSAAGENAIHTKGKSMGKYIRNPKRYYEKTLTVESNFPDAAQAGLQEIYDSEKDMVYLSLPGVRRILGRIEIFAESNQLYVFNGESLKGNGLWDWVNTWERDLERGELSVDTRNTGNKNFSVLTLSFPAEGISQRPRINKWKIWVSQQDHLPWKYHGYVPGQEEPVFISEYLELKLNQGLKPDDLEFEGMSFWKFPAQFVANTEGLDQLKAEKLEKVKEPAPEFLEIKNNLIKALEGVRDYQARVNTTQKYFRIRGAGTMDFVYKRDPLFYYIYFHDDTRLNIIHPATPGSKLCYDRENRYYRIIGGGMMRLVGVQELPIDDPRYDYACGESFSAMNLFELVRRMHWYEKHGTVSTDMVRFHEQVVPRVVMRRRGQPLQGQIQNMAIIFDPQTCMPLRVEYFGNPDPEGFTYFDYIEIKTNTGIEESDYYF